MKSVYLVVLKAALLLLTEGSAGTNENIKDGKSLDACPVKLKPSGECDEGEECTYQINLPPMTLQLPKQFQMIEKALKEVQDLKEVVNSLKKSCQDCKLQADDNQETNSHEFLLPDREGPTDASHGEDNRVKELQDKVSRLSSSLKNAKNQIHSLQGQMEQISLVHMNNVESYVDRKVANLTFAVNSLNNKCSSDCQVIGPQSVIQFLHGDCADYFAVGKRRNGIYRITPNVNTEGFEVYCDMEAMGGGWTVIQRRLDGSTNFNRTWNEYKTGFGNLSREFWLGNEKINLLTKRKEMQLRIELEDFSGVSEYAMYEKFYVANEYLKYRLSVGSYSGTVGDALHFKRSHSHDQRFFTTPDRDNDRYLPGNCGAYYSSGWWFDACLAANLNGRYYNKKYKGIHDGIYWGTWHNNSSLNGYRHSFKKVKMMIRPKGFIS